MNVVNHVISTKNEYVTSPYGYRTINGVTEMHNGVDLVDANRKERTGDVGILAFLDGKVVAAAKGSLVGNYVDIAHNGMILTRYFHMKDYSVKVKTGESVVKGQQIGIMGTTGDSTGIHLHFAVKENSTYYDNGVYVDPVPYLEGRKSIPDMSAPVQPLPIASDTFAVNDIVRIKSSAVVWATGQTIPSWCKGGKYKIIQLAPEKALLADVVSWIKTTDIEKV